MVKSMKINKKIMFFLLLFFIIIGLSAVSAEDVQDDTTVSNDIADTIDVADNIINDNNIIKTVEKTRTKGDSSSSVSDYASLSDKINEIKEDTVNDEYTIDLEDGTYEVTAPITWGSAKKVKTLTINGNNQIIKGNSNQFITINKGYTLNLNNIVISGCENTQDGGAIINKGTLNLDTVTLENNKANFGGAIVNSKEINIKDSTFINNSAVNGGALANTNYATATIENTLFESNTADSIGGAIENEHYSEMTVTDSTFTLNSAVNGGAIDNNQATLTLTGNTFDANNATDYAGAIYCRLFATINMYDNKLINNYAGDDGGAIYNYFNTTFIGENNVISFNKALSYGAAIYNDEATMIFTKNNITDNEVLTYGGGAVYNTNYANGHFIENIFANNTAKTNGGVIYVSSSNLELIGNTIEDNVARQGGALYLIQFCNVNITDNILKNNVASTNAGAIYTNSVLLMRITGNTITDNKAADGAALFSTGGNVLFDSNTVSNNVATTAGKKVVSNTGTLVSTNNIFTNNTDGTDMLMSETGKNTVNSNTYTANKLETIIEQVEQQPVIGDYDLEIKVSAKDVYNTTVDSGNILVTLNGAEYYSGALADSSIVTIKIDDLLDDNKVVVKYTPINDDFQESTMEFDMKSTNELKVSDYESLYNTVEKIKQDPKFDEFIINLEEGNYEVTTPIEWTDSVNAKTLTINGNGQEIKGNGKNFINIDEEYTLVLNDITVSGCESQQDGGAITNEGCLNLINVTFKDNKANFGGAIVSHNIITITDSTFINNSANNGGALANTNYATATITNTLFQDNSAVTMGGAIYNEHQSEMTIDNGTFIANTANNGGAIDNDQATLSIEKSLFEENVCLDYAGAIYNRFYATLTVKNNLFINNQAIEDEGGVFYNYFKSTLIAEGNLFQDNYAFRYGALIFNDDSEATFTLNIIQRCTVGKFGGSVIYNANGGHATFESNIIANNSAVTNGGAVYTASSDIDLIDNLFIGNTARQGAALYFIGANTNNVINNTIINNIAETNGGAIYNTANQPLTVTGNTIDNNVAAQGAVLYSTGEVTFTDNTVNDNTVSNPSGKVIYNTNKLTATGNAFTNNTDGNDILMSETGTNTVSDNTYEANMLETSIDGVADKNISSDYTFDVNVNAKEVYNCIVDSGNIVVKVNDKEYATEAIKDGKATISIKVDDLSDENDVVIDYVSDSTDFQNTTLSVKVYVVTPEAIVIIDDISDMQYRDYVTISGKVTTNTDEVVANTDVTVDYMGNIKQVKTDDEGIFTTTARVTTLGINEVTVIFEGNEKIVGASTTTTFNADKRDIELIVDEITQVEYRDNVTIAGKVTDKDNTKFKNANIFITLNDEQYQLKTDENGEFTLDFIALQIGTNNLDIVYKGNANYNKATITTTFEVAKRDIELIVDEITQVNYRDNITITGKLTDKDNTKFKNANVFITLNDEQYQLKTDNNGEFTLNVKANKTGTNTLDIVYKGNANYNKAKISTTFEVVKRETQVTINPIKDTTVNTEISITGKLKDQQGTKLKNANVIVSVNGKQTRILTDNYGMFNLTYTPTVVGVNNITVIYKGNVNYDGTSANSTFTVVKA